MQQENTFDQLPNEKQDFTNSGKVVDGAYVALQAKENKVQSKNGEIGWIDAYFKISERGSTVGTEIRSGLVAWMTMSYILLVNPTILHLASTLGDAFRMDDLVSSTALTAAFASLFVGLTTNLPFCIMPGMGLNAYFTFGICQLLDVSWQKALSCCFVSGVVLLVLSALGTTTWIQRMVPNHLKKAITVAIGLFQALIGFQTMGLVVSSNTTLVTLGDIDWNSNPSLYIAIAGFLFISTLLASCSVQGAMFIGIWGISASSWIYGLSSLPEGFLRGPSFGTVGVIDFSGFNPASSECWALCGASATILAVMIFDVAGVQYGIAMRAKLLDEHDEVPRGKWGFVSVACGTIFGSCLGTSPVIIANESSAGVMEGARTGLSSCICAVLFVISAFTSPLLTSVPRIATSVPLVLVGGFMMAPVAGIDWDDLLVAIPSFVTITVVPFTYSISNGVVAGLLVQMYLDLTAFVLRYFGIGIDLKEKVESLASVLITPHSPMEFTTPTSWRAESLTTPESWSLSTSASEEGKPSEQKSAERDKDIRHAAGRRDAACCLRSAR